jgi:hypothetical protein
LGAACFGAVPGLSTGCHFHRERQNIFDSTADAIRRLGAQCPKHSICELLLLPLGLILTYVYVWILDDAFVYFRHADNALLGNGLVNGAVVVHILRKKA